jgi:hypothetical protein
MSSYTDYQRQAGSDISGIEKFVVATGKKGEMGGVYMMTQV